MPENDLSKLLNPDGLRKITELTVLALTDYTAEDSDLYALRCICSICTLYSRLLDMVSYKQMLEAKFGKPAKESYRQLCKEQAVCVPTAQEQTFASEELGRIWLENFWQEYIS